MAGAPCDKQPPDALAVGRVRCQVGTAPVVGSALNDSMAAGEHAYWGESGFVKIGIPTPLLIKELGASRPPENPAEPRGGETPQTPWSLAALHFCATLNGDENYEEGGTSC